MAEQTCTPFHRPFSFFGKRSKQRSFSKVVALKSANAMNTKDLKQLAAIDLLPQGRRAILLALKQAGHATIPELAATLSISTEAVRQQLGYLHREGWIVTDCGPDEDDDQIRTPGRPPADYCLSATADDLFPKRYTELTLRFFDELPGVEQALSAMTDERVEELAVAIPEQPLKERIEALRSIYLADDPYTDVERSERGYRLIERNCPYLQFAKERPLFCSTTVSTLRRLTNREVVREQRFQDGDGRCVFHIYLDAPVTGSRKERRFESEPAKDARPERTKQSRS
jgi:predicted ArsR family transcriptional regulator